MTHEQHLALDLIVRLANRFGPASRIAKELPGWLEYLTEVECETGIRKWMTFYNHQRPHSALGASPPAVVYRLRKDETQPNQRVQRVA
jgi:transposase InsO family protein